MVIEVGNLVVINRGIHKDLIALVLEKTSTEYFSKTYFNFLLYIPNVSKCLEYWEEEIFFL